MREWVRAFRPLGVSLSIAIQLSLHGHHAEHARADRVATDLQNLSGCFHPHFAGVTIPGHFVTGYRRPRAFRLPGTRVQRVFYPHRGCDHSRPLFTNRLNYSTRTPFLSRPRTMQPAAAESPTPLWHCSNRIQDRTHLGARRTNPRDVSTTKSARWRFS